MPLYLYQCRYCGKEIEQYLKVEERHQSPECCGLKMNMLFTPPNIHGCDSFNQHYDLSLGKHFESKEEKKQFLAKEGMEQLNGAYSPKESTKQQTICSKSAARKIDKRA